MNTSIVTETVILSYLEKNKGLSIGEAFINWQLSGGHITKLISNLRKQGHEIDKAWRHNPVTKRRYAYYTLKAKRMESSQSVFSF